jgi:hypothetical protein
MITCRRKAAPIAFGPRLKFCIPRHYPLSTVIGPYTDGPGPFAPNARTPCHRTCVLPPVFGIRAELQPPSEPARAAGPLGRSLEQSLKGKRLNLLPLFLAPIFLAVFSPKIACQAPRPSNPFPHSDIHVHVSYAPTAIMNIEIQNKPVPDTCLG